MLCAGRLLYTESLTQSMQMRTSSYFSSYGNSTLANKMCASGIEVEGEGGGEGTASNKCDKDVDK